MIVVGLTGGIGSGKTTVANMFESLGVPVYIADYEAKRLMNNSKVIRRKLIELFGDDAYINRKLNRSAIALKIFNNKDLLEKMNKIIHPRVASHFKKWLNKQDTLYVIKEAAIIFEHEMQGQYDYVITVTAPSEDKIERVLKRDDTTRDKIISIMKNQLPDEQKVKLSDFVIVNDQLLNTSKQVIDIHYKILHKHR